MTTTRHPGFYANFFRAVRSCEPTTYRSLRRPPTQSSQLRVPERRSQSTFQNRYGPAATQGLPPPPKPGSSLESKQEGSGEARPKDSTKIESQNGSEKQAKKVELVQETKEQPSTATKKKAEVVAQEPTTIDATAKTTPQPSASAASSSAASSSATKTQAEPLTIDLESQGTNATRELDMVLSIPSPNELKGKASRHPHLEASLYEHHFDTYSLVQDLSTSNPEEKSFTQEQSVTLMKAIRLMLSNNLDIAKEGLVSKSDVENESYLFRAACSELRTTLQGSRFAENQRQRSNRAQLQHEFDILNQKVNQDVLNMREELKGLFNDRKMTLQEEKRKIDSKISELNYEITVLLNSEAKSEVEGLRWVLTRRAALAVGVAAFMVLSALQYYSVKSRELAEIEKKRLAAQKATEERMKETEMARYTTPSRDSGTQTASEGLVEESLG